MCMEKKLIHLFNEIRGEETRKPNGETFKVIDRWEMITVNGVFDDGTWEPLIKYRIDGDDWKKINLRTFKGVFKKNRSNVIETLKKVCEEYPHKSVELLIK